MSANKTQRTSTDRKDDTKSTPRTETESKLWKALQASPGSTAAALATAAGIGRSTAPKILTRWAGAGVVTRTTGIADGGSRPADRWSITRDDAPADEHSGTSDATSPSLPEAADAAPTGKRLPPGALRGMVEDYLRDNPGDHTPNAIGQALRRSSGAVHNALEKLVDGGHAQRTCDKPKKYALSR